MQYKCFFIIIQQIYTHTHTNWSKSYFTIMIFYQHNFISNFLPQLNQKLNPNKHSKWPPTSPKLI